MITIFFWLLLPFVKNDSCHFCVVKQRLLLKEWTGLLLVLTMINKGFVLIIKYKLLIVDGIQNWFDWFSHYVLPCHYWHHHHDSVVCMHLNWCLLTITTSIKVIFSSKPTRCSLGIASRTNLTNFSSMSYQCGCWQHHHDSGVCMHLTWCSLNDNYGVNILCGHKKIFLFLESISYLVSNLIIKYFQLLRTNNSVDLHSSCSDNLTLLKYKLLALSQTSSLKVEVDSLEIELVMV